ncbi:hypothetical protein [Mariprofundus ferrooxydans]|uniref:hypothetical protein n=1 Tax=Mariprofundus ferrooxydans TaxID=314344 RepID=UPI0014306898|nr:hypothetical protein [Mariprofundus ferrooxydans]
MASKSHIKVTLDHDDMQVLRALAERHGAAPAAVLQEIVGCALDVARERLTKK